MSEWIKAALVADFSGPVVQVEIDGRYIALFQLEDGYYAIDDECSHAVASLSEGEIVDGCKIECPRHGAQFDIRTGENLCFPAVVPVRSYPAREEDGVVYLHMEAHK